MIKLAMASLILTLTTVTWAADKPLKRTPGSATQITAIRADYAPGEITQICESSIQEARTKSLEVEKIPVDARNFDNTILALETIDVELSEKLNPLSAMGNVSPSKASRDEADACDQKWSAFSEEITARKPLYQALKSAKPRNPEETRLFQKTMEYYERKGLNLPDDKLAKLVEINTRLAKLSLDFSSNLSNDVSTLILTKEELEGATPNFLARLKKQGDKYIVTVKGPDYTEVMRDVKNADVRRRMMLAWQNRASEANNKILKELLPLRMKAAQMLGFKNWADYMIQPKMAKTSDEVMKFLNGLRGKLAESNRKDMAQLLALKKEMDPKASGLDPWDQDYYENLLKKRSYNLDDELVSEYFPLEPVFKEILNIYSKILGVTFKEVIGVKVWAEGVKQFEIRDAKSKAVLGFFYTDFFPREGKYGHAAAANLIPTYRRPDGTRNQTISMIMMNARAPANGRPSLLLHDTVKTLFHEFGHIMHQTLSRAPYASLAGSVVARDFVEAPSQMLENWVWDPKILNEISGHYTDRSKKLPKELLASMLAARDFQQGKFYTRQLLFGLFDMKVHSQESGEVNAGQVYNELYRDIVGLEPVKGNNWPASFGHLMGYSAGYYGYLWSKVYAEDMFTVFKKRGLKSSSAGARYRKVILEQGNMKDAIDLVREFLGREPKPDAFFKTLGI